MTAEALATAVGCERSYISGIEGGKEKPPAKLLCTKIAHALNVPSEGVWRAAVWERLPADERATLRQMIDEVRPRTRSGDQAHAQQAIGMIEALRPDLRLAWALAITLGRLAGYDAQREFSDLPTFGSRPEFAPRATNTESLDAFAEVVSTMASLDDRTAAGLAVALQGVAHAVETAHSKGQESVSRPTSPRRRETRPQDRE